MPKLIKDGETATDEWSLYSATEIDTKQLSQGKWILPLNLFQKLTSEGSSVDWQNTGLSLASDDDIADLVTDENVFEKLSVIALQFNAFTDGRSFSQARMLREHYDYNGELRAVGSFIQDQLFYLSRCGVNAFLLSDDADIDSCLESLRDFSDSYQAACDEPQPLFRRRV